MTTLSCRDVARDCLDTLSAADSKEIQKVFLDHVHAKHPQQWKEFSKQYRAVSLVTLRDRFRTQAAKGLKVGIPVIGGPSLSSETAASGSPS